MWEPGLDPKIAWLQSPPFVLLYQTRVVQNIFWYLLAVFYRINNCLGLDQDSTILDSIPLALMEWTFSYLHKDFYGKNLAFPGM